MPTLPLPRVNPTCLLAAMMLAAGDSSSADWPRYRGPGLNGITTEAGLKVSGEAEVLWKAEVGLGFSAPVIAEGRVVISGHDGSEWDTVYCFQENSGDLIWKHRYPQPLGDLYFKGGTTGTASIEDGRVYHLAREGELSCLDAATGKPIWSKQLCQDFGYKKPTWGFSGAPLVWEDYLYLNAGDAGLCLNKKDGSLVWKSENEEAGYSSPYPLERQGRRLCIFSNKRGYVCVNATTGKEVWRYKWMTRYGVNAADPIVYGDEILISSGYGKGATLLHWTEGDQLEKVWQNREFQAQMNAPLLIDGHLYGVSGNEGQDGTGLRCVEWATGQVKWSAPSVGHGAASAVEGMLLVLTERGELQIAPVSPHEYKPVFQQEILNPKVWTVPVFANGRGYCRNDRGQFVVLKLVP